MTVFPNIKCRDRSLIRPFDTSQRIFLPPTLGPFCFRSGVTSTLMMSFTGTFFAPRGTPLHGTHFKRQKWICPKLVPRCTQDQANSGKSRQRNWLISLVSDCEKLFEFAQTWNLKSVFRKEVRVRVSPRAPITIFKKNVGSGF